jgi:hypothetical protein
MTDRSVPQREKGLFAQRGELGSVLRGDELGKKYFGQILERVGPMQVQDRWIIAEELKLLQGHWRMTGTVAGIAAIVIFMLFEGRTRALVRHGDFGKRYPAPCRGGMTLPGMSAVKHTTERDGQHDRE